VIWITTFTVNQKYIGLSQHGKECMRVISSYSCLLGEKYTVAGILKE
jgi:hypothetical protein